MKKSIIIFTAVFLIASLAAIKTAFGQSTVEKALTDVKGTFDSLIGAKDSNNPQKLSFKIETYRKVIDFSIAETKDLRVRLLAIESVDEHLVPWQEESLQNLSRAGEYYERQKKILWEKENVITEDELKELARNFKNERDSKFLPTVNQIKDFLMIYQEKSSIETAKKRWDKIQDDVKKLQKSRAKTAPSLLLMLNKADKYINEAQMLNSAAEQVFWKNYAYMGTSTFTNIPEIEGSSTPTAVSTTDNASSSQNIAFGEASSTAENIIESSSTIAISSSTATSTEVSAPKQVSIRDLVKSSLMKVKDAYQVFIEMSSLVRSGLK